MKKDKKNSSIFDFSKLSAEEEISILKKAAIGANKMQWDFFCFDQEMSDLAEMGFEDYSQQIKNYETKRNLFS